MELPPALAERFTAVGPLGRGGFGQVIECRDRELGRAVAIKLTPLAGGDVASRRRADREARLLASIACPGVVRILDAGVTEDVAYLVMERLEGQDLESRLAGGACLDKLEVVSLVQSLLETLAAVHAQGILHRDIKPGNIFLRDGSDPVLVDFGIARRVDASTRLTRPGQRIGSLRYLAPEVLASGECSARSDLYSLAVTAFASLVDLDLHTGGPRDSVLTAPALVSSVASGTYVPCAQRALAGAGRFGDSLLRAMSRDPRDRPASASAWLEELRALDRAAPRPRQRPSGGRRP